MEYDICTLLANIIKYPIGWNIKNKPTAKKMNIILES